MPENNIFSIEYIERSLNSLKSGKAPGIDKISKEHIMFSHPAVFIRVLCLFNCMMLHGCVSDLFGVGIVVPLVKDSLGNVNDSAIIEALH